MKHYINKIKELGITNKYLGFPGSLVVNNSHTNAGDMGVIPGSGRAPMP